MVRSTLGKHPLYFEAILQLRDVSSAVIKYAEQEIRHNLIPLAKTVTTSNGQDYYLADSKFTKALGKRLQQEFGGQLLLTASLYGQKEGKEIYRITVLFRQASFQKRDTVFYRGEEYKVLAMGKEIVVQKLPAGKKLHLKYKEMGKIRKAPAL